MASINSNRSFEGDVLDYVHGISIALRIRCIPDSVARFMRRMSFFNNTVK